MIAQELQEIFPSLGFMYPLNKSLAPTASIYRKRFDTAEKSATLKLMAAKRCPKGIVEPVGCQHTAPKAVQQAS